MKVSDNSAVRLTAAAVALAFALAGCGSSEDKAASSSSSAAPTSSSAPTEEATPEEATPAAADADYSALLMAAEDFPDIGVAFTADPPLLTPNGMEGVAQVFRTPTNELIGDTIVFLADPAEAANVLTKATEALGASVTGTPQPSPIGTNGTFATGTSPDGLKGVSVLMFTNDNAFVTLQFDSAEGDLEPAPTDYVEAVGQLQLDALQAG